SWVILPLMQVRVSERAQDAAAGHFADTDLAGQRRAGLEWHEEQVVLHVGGNGALCRRQIGAALLQGLFEEPETVVRIAGPCHAPSVAAMPARRGMESSSVRV